MEKEAGYTTLSDSTLNESMVGPKGKKRRTLEDFEFVLNENSKFKSSDLGKGSYGTVKKVRDKHTGRIFAMKIMNKKAIFEYSTKENLKREIIIQKEISHPHIVKLYTYFEDNENVYLVLEFAENGSLFQYLRKRRKFTEKEAFVYFFQTCLGIDYLHKRKVIHRDLKPENLLLDVDGNIKLCDFGWSADTASKRHTFCGTVDYMAPEMLKNHPYDHRLDIWCLGILLYEMLHGHAPYKGRNDKEICNNISMNTSINFDPTLSSNAVELIKKILQPVPINRINMLGIFQHPWMKEQEKTHKMSIMEYVNQQDRQIRELERNGGVEIFGKGSQESKSQKTEAQTSANKAKIITIQDNTSPLIMVQKSNSEENKKPSYNGSTKESDAGSTGSLAGRNIEQILKGYHYQSGKKAESAGLKSSVDNYGSLFLAQSMYNMKTDTESESPKFGQKKYKGEKDYYPQHKQIFEEDDEDLEPNRLSRLSKKNISALTESRSKDKKEPGLFEKVLIGLGCISRDNRMGNGY